MFSENKTTIHHGDQQNGTSQSKTSLLRGLLADTATGHLLSGPATNPPQNDAVAVKLTTECQEELNSKLAAWLIRAVQFTKSLPVFYMLNTHDQLVLLNSSWKDLVLLYMAEENYECCVERDESHEPGSTTYQLFSEGIPTHKSVEQLNFALERCRSSRLDLKEYAYLRKIALLNSEVRSLCNVAAIEESCESAQSSLMEYLNVTHPSDPLRLSHVLLLLPSIRGYSTKIFENLFYHHLLGDTSMESILLEILQ